MILPGNTFLVPSGKEGKHLFFVALGPVVLPDSGRIPRFVLVSATTLYEKIPYDPACILEEGDHPFIHHKSYIAYRHMRIDPQPDVERLADFVWTRQQDCEKTILERIVSGIFRSRFTPRHVKQALGDIGGQEI
jgi:hypothetical protein